MRELYEVMYNIMGRDPKLAYFSHDWAVKIAKIIPNWQYFNLDTLLKNKENIIVSPDARKIDELCITPVSFPVIAEKIIWDHKARYPGSKDEFER